MPSTALLLHWSATREQQESSQQQDQRETISTVLRMLVSDRFHVREKSSETDTCPGQLLILLVHHTHGFEFCRQLRMCTPKRGRQVHEALEFFLCESFAKHGERCRIWEAERFSTAERIALGVGRTRVRDEAEPLHDEALSGGGAIFFVVTCLRNWPFCVRDCAVALPLAAAISGSRADGCYAAQSKFSPLSLRSFGEHNESFRI